MLASLNLIVGSLVAAGVLSGVLFWWFKRDWFAGLGVAAASGALAGLITLTWPDPGPLDVEGQREAAHLDTRNLRAKPNQSDLADQRADQERQRRLMLASVETYAPYRPAEKPSAGYVASDACRECHKENYETWHDSYHRTMTQVATPDAVYANFDNHEITLRGRHYRLTRNGEVCQAEMFDPDYPPSPQTRMKVPLVMVTGSHHMQVFWYPGFAPRTLGQLPIVYLKETQQWIPRRAAFLVPPDEPVSSELGRWNEGCSNCHSTHRRERWREPGTWDTEVTELGISCEACHGPGEEHIALHRAQASDIRNDPIINPASLSHVASSHTCGQCHGKTSLKTSGSHLNEFGHDFRPGDDLNDTHHIWERDSKVVRDFVASMNFEEGADAALRRVYWDDGNIRVSGREFNGMAHSACFQRGEISCLSCHQMHQSESDQRDRMEWANDQLSVTGLDDHACTQCHKASDYGESHTHHAAASAGSRCYNCHMPHTSYGLIKAMRSHTITSPILAKDLKVKRPNACNLCHLDQTLQWTSNQLSKWYGIEEVADLSDEQKTVAASVIGLLKGDAGERALWVCSMGWQPAQQASGNDWMAPFLARLMVDPYPAVRLMARRSLRTLPGLHDLQFNAVAPEPERENVLARTLAGWSYEAVKDKRPAILIEDTGLQTDRIEAMMKQRDDTRINLLE